MLVRRRWAPVKDALSSLHNDDDDDDDDDLYTYKLDFKSKVSIFTLCLWY